jgi:hypothetical protein
MRLNRLVTRKHVDGENEKADAYYAQKCLADKSAESRRESKCTNKCSHHDSLAVMRYALMLAFIPFIPVRHASNSGAEHRIPPDGSGSAS